MVESKKIEYNKSGPVFEFGPGWGEKISKWLKKNTSTKVLPSIALIVLIIGVFSVLKNKTNQDKFVLDLNNIKNESGTIIETARPRDGYAILARRALAKYIETTAVSLTPGQKLFIEENLRQIIETGPLEIGQEVKFLISDISSAINHSKKLTASQLQKWESWAETVNFNK